MGARVAAAGHELVVFNRTRPKAEELAQRTGAQVADTAARGRGVRGGLPGFARRRRGGGSDLSRG